LPGATAVITTPSLIVTVPDCQQALPGDAPIRFGALAMEPLCRDLFVEPGLTDDERTGIAQGYASARNDVGRVLGPLASAPPLVIVCKTDVCAAYFAGSARRSWTLAPGDRLPGATYVASSRVTILVVRADERARAVMAHETVHVEVRHRLHGRDAPLWFHEGLAALVSGEPPCAHPGERGVDDLRRLARNAAWVEHTNMPGTLGPTYCQARAEVAIWVNKHGARALLDLLERVGAGAEFDAAYGPLTTQPPGPIPTLIVSAAASLGDERPFTLAMWIKPAAATGTLAHVSATPVGTGWCFPFVGYDAGHHIVAQLFHGTSPDRASFAVAVDSTLRPLGVWTHVAMTWGPNRGSRLYVNGTLATETAAPRYNAPGGGAPVYVAWGSSNVGGAVCWPGAIAQGAFDGSIADERVFDVELGAAEVAALAHIHP